MAPTREKEPQRRARAMALRSVRNGLVFLGILLLVVTLVNLLAGDTSNVPFDYDFFE